MKYVEFASKISFYEFLQQEFKQCHFKTRSYREEIELLQQTLTIEDLTQTLQKRPKVIDIFEELLQLKRFTNAQYINFCFDVNVLNNYDEYLVLKYIKNSTVKFENGKPNDNFSGIYDRLCTTVSPTPTETVFFAKRSIVKYIDRLIKNREALYHHIQNSIGTRLRIARYLLENLNAVEILSSVNLERFLSQKRHPIDTKSLHGRFGTIKILKILNEAGFTDITASIKSPILSSQSIREKHIPQDNYAYIREKAIEGINKRKDGKPKKFDFILLSGGTPRLLIETNFYSTSGTKIGINQGEYVDLHEDVKRFNSKNNTNFQFMWITDGNYWLSPDGESRFINLKTNFFKGDLELLNYKMLQESLPNIKKSIS